MKRLTLNFLLFLGIGFFAVVLTGCESKSVLSQSNTPAEITGYIQSNFPEYKVLQTVKERDGLHIKYKLILDPGLSLEFNRKKEIVEIDGKRPLPKTVIPTEIGQYISSNFPTNAVTEWEIEDNRQKIRLDNGLEILFTKNGDFVRIDD